MMKRVLGGCLPFFAVVCVVAGCSGSSIAINNAITQAGSPVAFLVYPASAPYAAQVAPATVVLAQSGLNSSYSVTVTPSGGGSPLPFTLNLNPLPQTLPSPLATPPAAIASSLASASGGSIVLAPTTTYTVTLTGCPQPNANGSCPTALQTIAAGSFQTNCGFPPPVPLSPVALIYLANPVPGATAVPTSIGRIIVGTFFLGPSTVSLTNGNVMIPLGAPTAAASPLPSPLATGPGGFTSPLVQLAAPALTSATTYTVLTSQNVFSSTNPPVCSTVNSQSIGTFTTQ